MRLENSFEVPASPEEVWAFLLDVERVAPCMPGAELTDVVDDETWEGKVNVKLGPVSLTYAGKVVIQERDEEAWRVVLKCDGRETRGKGTASAVVTSSLEPVDGGATRVSIVTDLTLSGAVAQYGRGMIADVSQRMTDQFADLLKEQMAAPEGVETPPLEQKPVAGIRLGLWAFVRAVGRFFSRIWGAVTRREGSVG